MALQWRPTRPKKLAIAVLNLVAPLLRPRAGKWAPGSASSVTSVAVIELWNIGDIVLAMPFLRSLRGAFPEAKIILVARPVAAQILEGTGLVDEYIAAALDWSGPEEGRRSVARGSIGLIKLARRLRKRRIDIAFSARPHLREYALLGLSGARRTVGYALGAASNALTDPIRIEDPDRHKTDDWSRLLEGVGGAVRREQPRLEISAEEREWARKFLDQGGFGRDETVVGIHPGASRPEKRWPMESFTTAASMLAQREGVRILAFVDPAGYGAELAALPGAVLAKPSLRQLIALLAECDVLLCNDSGPMHLAAGVGTPVVALFGAGIERWFAPLAPPDKMVILEPPDSPAIVTESGIRSPERIPVANVVQAVSALLAGSSRDPR